jgi:hypothetical protein
VIDRRPRNGFEPQDVRRVHSRFEQVLDRAIRREGSTLKQIKEQARKSVTIKWNTWKRVA